MSYLITGAARGIGRGLTRSLLSQGHRVFLVDNNKAELENTLSLAAKWAASGPVITGNPHTLNSEFAFHGALVDLSDRSQVKEAVTNATLFFGGKLDVLINNAIPVPHIWQDGKGMEDKDEEDSIMQEWDEKIAVGLTAPFLLARLCVPLLRAATSSPSSNLAAISMPDPLRQVRHQTRPGCIINISSTRAYQAEDNHEAYSAVKAGILGLTQSLAVSLGHRHGIRVNAIIPGWISVDDENAVADREGTKWGDALTEQDHQWHPAGRVGKAEDILKTVQFLVDSDFITGQEIVVDGGVTRKMVYPE